MYYLIRLATSATMAKNDDVLPEQSLDISEKYENPLDKPETSYIDSFAVLKDRIRHHYEICSGYYLSLW